MSIRRAVESDIPAIARIECLCFSSPWSEQSIKESFESDSNRFYIAENKGEIEGYLGLFVSIDMCDILNIAVLPEYRRQGVAKALVSFVIEGYKDKIGGLTLEVRPSNVPALALYEGFGFEQVGRRKDYYRNPTEDALLMTKFFTVDGDQINENTFN